jgi:hypothetical protein
MNKYTSENWYSCQVGNRKIFQVHKMSWSRMLTINSKQTTFKVQQKPDIDINRRYPAMANYDNKTCFVIGGIGWEGPIDFILNTVSSYNISKDSWQQGTPSLQIPRESAAACTFKEFVFVFAGNGLNNDQNFANESVERIHVPAIDRGEAAWELINLP